ncbi:GyrI-like domain-containing protein [Pontibacter cellulosilyticus]|uniref:GyrI-like domain-containing protein n=1 Tax=Pontibacter cellulosilyticus TaxID=1720253 RepID=A0A923N606_9BACT|nr:GyrI-like domain-containing protein [Pontibacter cellulosilyticus]MBC5992382.1 GyrI-like domain-containing protein [Pontibacter cellulosilyticus]
MQQPQIVSTQPRHLIGKRITTSLATNDAVALWSSFMPLLKEIRKRVGQQLYSVQVYPESIRMDKFTPETPFEKWAAVEVTETGILPEGMEELQLPGGLYAVFVHKGPASEFHKTAQYIFGTWLPQSEYQLDNRPQFEVMGEKYLGHTHPDSEEEVWVPVKHKV